MLQQVGRAAERRDHMDEALRCRAAGEGVLDFCDRLFARRGEPAEQQHLGGERYRDFMEAWLAPPAGQMVERIGDLERIAGGGGERLAHIGEQRPRRQAGAVADIAEALRQRLGLVELAHEGAGAELHVHGEAGEAGGELLRQDRSGDQRDRFDRAGDVPDRIEPLVGRGEIGGLADDGAAGLAHDMAEEIDPRLGDIARHRVELVECAAGMAEAAAGDHRDIAAASRDGRRERQRDGVADAAGRVLVERWARQVAPVQHRAGIAHGQCQRDALLRVHVAEEDRHGEGGGLALADRAVGQAGDHLADVLGVEALAVALGGDDLLRQAHQ